MGHILRNIGRSNLHSGGVLKNATGDPCQLSATTSHDMICSPMITSFNIHTLKHFVRTEYSRGQEMAKWMCVKPIPSDMVNMLLKAGTKMD